MKYSNDREKRKTSKSPSNIKKLKIKKETLIFFSYLFVLFILFSFKLNSYDIISDEGHYTLRSLFLVDRIYSAGQATNYVIFNGDIPWWGKIHYHDHPIFSFLVRHFGLLFSPTIEASRYVSVLFILIGIYYLLLIMTRFLNFTPFQSIFLSIILILSTFFYCFCTTAFIEPILFGLMSAFTYYHFSFIKTRKDKYLLLSTLFLSLSILTKYTSFILIPFYFYSLYLVFSRDIKLFFKSIFIFLSIISPIYIYNILLYIHKGYMDLQFSRLFHLQSKRPDAIFFKNLSPMYITNLKNLIVRYIKNDIAIFLISIISLIFLLYLLFRGYRNYFHIFGISLFFLFVLFFAIVGSPYRYLLPFNFSLFLLILLAFSKVNTIFTSHKMRCIYYILFIFSVGCVIAYFIYLNIDSSSYLSNFFRDMGYRALDKSIDNIFSNDKNTIIFYDESMNFFLESWHIGKYVYKGYYIFPLSYFDSVLKHLGESINMYHIYIIFTTNNTLRDPNSEDIVKNYQLFKQKNKEHLELYTIIKVKDKHMFEIYLLKNKSLR